MTVFVRENWRLVPRQDWRAFADQCLSLWDQGLDTYEIAKILFRSEAAVDKACRLGREERRAP